MGISSDAMLYFGFPVGEDEQPPEWYEDGNIKDFDNWICQLAELPEDAKYEQRKPIIKACPAELQMYCSYDYPMYILAVRGEEIRVNRGFFEEIHIDALTVDQEKIDAFKRWCEQNNIKYKEPKWLLCSMYG